MEQNEIRSLVNKLSHEKSQIRKGVKETLFLLIASDEAVDLYHVVAIPIMEFIGRKTYRGYSEAVSVLAVINDDRIEKYIRKNFEHALMVQVLYDIGSDIAESDILKLAGAAVKVKTSSRARNVVTDILSDLFPDASDSEVTQMIEVLGDTGWFSKHAKDRRRLVAEIRARMAAKPEPAAPQPQPASPVSPLVRPRMPVAPGNTQTRVEETDELERVSEDPEEVEVKRFSLEDE